MQFARNAVTVFVYSFGWADACLCNRIKDLSLYAVLYALSHSLSADIRNVSRSAKAFSVFDVEYEILSTFVSHNLVGKFIAFAIDELLSFPTKVTVLHAIPL